jgi:hypothetical protein
LSEACRGGRGLRSLHQSALPSKISSRAAAM